MRESVHMADMIDVGMALDHQSDVVWREAKLCQLSRGHIIVRDGQNATEATKIILRCSRLRVFGVFLRKACIDQDGLIRVRLDDKAANADDATIGMDLKQAIIQHGQTNGFAL